jgi:hypothetical protein
MSVLCQSLCDDGDGVGQFGRSRLLGRLAVVHARNQATCRGGLVELYAIRCLRLIPQPVLAHNAVQPALRLRGVVAHRSFAAALSNSVYSFFIPWTLVKLGVEREVMTPIGAPRSFGNSRNGRRSSEGNGCRAGESGHAGLATWSEFRCDAEVNCSVRGNSICRSDFLSPGMNKISTGLTVNPRRVFAGHSEVSGIQSNPGPDDWRRVGLIAMSLRHRAGLEWKEDKPKPP